MRKRFFQSPPMGWNSYDNYDTNVDETAVRANAEVMAELMRPFGWEYVVVDIQWYAYDTASQRDTYQYLPFSEVEMDAYGRLLPCPQKFPSAAKGRGFAPLAEYIHGLGLKFGIHIMRGIPRRAAHESLPILGTEATAAEIADPCSICGWNPDMYGVRATPAGQAYYDSLFKLYASWGVDFVKCDDICNTNLYKDSFAAREEIKMIHRAIERCGREMVLSLSPGPALLEQAWYYQAHANLWRMTDDLWDNWGQVKEMFTRCAQWQDHVAMGGYPDCDMLPLGHIGDGFGKGRMTNLTPDEQRTMMTLWCIFRSPLMIGADLTRLDEFTLELLTNPAVLELNREGNTARQAALYDTHAVWVSRDAKGTALTVALFNLSEEKAEVRAPLSLLLRTAGMEERSFGRCTDLWTREQSVGPDGAVGASLAPHACALLRLD